MSRRKKSIGKVKPPWFGKTTASLLRRIEQMLDPSYKGSVQMRVTDNRRVNIDEHSYRGGRTTRARREIAAAAKEHPIGSWVSGRCGELFVGKVVRIRNGKYTLRLVDGSTKSVPFWVELKRTGDQNA